MENITNELVYTGDLLGYSNRWNFFSNIINVVVRINGKSVKVPIDYRQRKFLQYEYPPGSKVDVGFNGQWYIKSRPVPDDFEPQAEVAPFYEL